LPRVVSALVEEMWNGANVAFALCPMLTHGRSRRWNRGVEHREADRHDRQLMADTGRSAVSASNDRIAS
jgi:hypothetical protein